MMSILPACFHRAALHQEEWLSGHIKESELEAR